MHNDLIERLRELLAAAENADEPVARYWSEQAAQLVRPYLPTLLDRIAALEGENERQKQQLRRFENAASIFQQLRSTICIRWDGTTEFALWQSINKAFDKLQSARAALEEPKP